jgi:hypothetical protein
VFSGENIGTRTQFKVQSATTNCLLSLYGYLTIFYKFTRFQVAKSTLSSHIFCWDQFAILCGYESRFHSGLCDDELFAIMLWLLNHISQIYNISSYKKCLKQSYLLWDLLAFICGLSQGFIIYPARRHRFDTFLRYRPDTLYAKVICIGQWWTVLTENLQRRVALDNTFPII